MVSKFWSVKFEILRVPFLYLPEIYILLLLCFFFIWVLSQLAIMLFSLKRIDFNIRVITQFLEKTITLSLESKVHWFVPVGGRFKDRLSDFLHSVSMYILSWHIQEINEKKNSFLNKFIKKHMHICVLLV